MGSNDIFLASGLLAHRSGAAFLPHSETLLVADLHLGYSWAQRRRGELGPLADARTREKLLAVCEELAPKRIVFLGDLVHAPRPCQEEYEWIEALIEELSRNAELIAVRGNHDRAFAKEFAQAPVKKVESWSNEGLWAIHGDRLPETVLNDRTMIMGHLHPCLPVIDAAGAGHKVPVFLATKQCVLLPAFSPFARGYNTACGLPSALLLHFGSDDIAVYAATATRVVRLGPLAYTLRQMFQANASAPAQFRRSHSAKRP